MTEETQKGFFSNEEVEQLLNLAAPAWKTIITLAVQHGLRFTEIQNLKEENLDLENNLISVVNPKSKLTRQIKTNKTFLAEVAELFENDLALKKLSISTFDSFTRRLGLNENLSFRSLRETYSHNLIKNGVSKDEVVKSLGHATSTL